MNSNGSNDGLSWRRLTRLQVFRHPQTGRGASQVEDLLYPLLKMDAGSRQLLCGFCGLRVDWKQS